MQVTHLLRDSLVLPESPSCLAASSDLPLLAGEVHSQQDVLLGVLPPVAVHHHHVAHAVAPHALQTHGLQSPSASLVLPQGFARSDYPQKLYLVQYGRYSKACCCFGEGKMS